MDILLSIMVFFLIYLFLFSLMEMIHTVYYEEINSAVQKTTYITSFEHSLLKYPKFDLI